MKRLTTFGLFILFLLPFHLFAQQETSPLQTRVVTPARPANHFSPKLSPLQRLSFTGGFEAIRFDPTRINDADQKVVKNLYGNGFSIGAEYQLTRHFALTGGFVRKHGHGEIAITDPELSNIDLPPDAADLGLTVDSVLGAFKEPKASLAFRTTSYRFGGKFNFLPGRRFDPFVGGSAMGMRIQSTTDGVVPAGFDFNTFTLITAPLHDITRELHPEFSVTTGVSFPLGFGVRGIASYEKTILHSDQVAFTTKVPLYALGIGHRPAY